MGRIASSGATSKHGQDSAKALRARLSYSEDIEVALARSPEVWSAMDIEINIKSTTCINGPRECSDDRIRRMLTRGIVICLEDKAPGKDTTSSGLHDGGL